MRPSKQQNTPHNKNNRKVDSPEDRHLKLPSGPTYMYTHTSVHTYINVPTHPNTHIQIPGCNCVKVDGTEQVSQKSAHTHS